GIVTLPLELPVRVAEDAAVLDLMCGGRLEVGIGPGGNLSAYDAFGLDSTERTALLVRHHHVLVEAWSGRALPGGDRLYPPIPGWPIGYGRQRSTSKARGVPVRRGMGWWCRGPSPGRGGRRAPRSPPPH